MIIRALFLFNLIRLIFEVESGYRVRPVREIASSLTRCEANEKLEIKKLKLDSIRKNTPGSIRKVKL